MKTKYIIRIILILLIPFLTSAQERDPVDITAMAVINRYIDAIGGKEKFENVKDRMTVIQGTTMGKEIKIVVQQKFPNKLKQEINPGEISQVMYFDGENGLMLTGENKTEIKGKELERLKIDATMQLLLNPESYGVKMELMRNETIDSVDCFKIKMTLPSGIRWFQYYDAGSGLKVKEIKEIQTEQGLFEQETSFSDYREVEGLKFPFKMNQSFGMQKIDMTVQSVKLNTGIDDSVFTLPE
jgi:outer membrane lipoprotein-sorting protein